MKLKTWLDSTFFLTEEELEEGEKVHYSNYLWVFGYIIVALIGMFIGVQALVQLQ